MAGIRAIADGLKDINKAVVNDCIKVLCEIGSRKPGLISDDAPPFNRLLHSRENRQVWGGMTALARIADICADEMYLHLGIIPEARQNGGVITVDQGIRVLAKRCAANDR